MAYWDQRLLEEQNALWVKSYLVSGQLKAEYGRSAKKIIKDMVGLYDRIQKGTATVNDL